jgi:hypothetical protein
MQWRIKLSYSMLREKQAWRKKNKQTNPLKVLNATSLNNITITVKKPTISSYRASSERQEKERLVTQAQLGRPRNIGRNTGAPHFHIPLTL